MRTERGWWIAAFFTISILIHIFLALHGPGFGIKVASVSPKGIELTLEPLPAEKKRLPPVKTPKSTEKPKTPPKVIEKKPVVPKVAIKPIVKPIVPPRIRIAKLLPTPKPRAALTPRTVAPEKMPEPMAARPSFTPRHVSTPVKLSIVNPLAGMTTPNDAPQMPAAPRSDSRSVLHSPSSRPSLAGAPSSVTTHAQIAADQPQTQPVGGSVQFPKIATRLGSTSVMSVNNPLAEDAVPEDKPGVGGARVATSGPSSFAPSVHSSLGGRVSHGTSQAKATADLPQTESVSSGVGITRMASRGTGGKSILSGINPLSGDASIDDKPGSGSAGAGIRGNGGSGLGVSGKGLASLRSGRGGKFGAGRGTGQPSASNADMPGTNGGSGHGTIGVGPNNGLRVAAGGNAFGGIGGLLRGDPTRTAGDGRPGANGHGLSAEIYEGNPYLTKLVHRRTDAMIDFDWGNHAAIIDGVSRVFSVRWTGQIAPKYSETYTLESHEDDGFKIWIDGKLMISDWNDHKTATKTCKIPMIAGHKYTVRIDYFENGIGAAEVHLYWASPSQPRQIVPESALFQAQ